MSSSRRPDGVTILALLYAVAGSVTLFVNLYLIGIATPVSPPATALGFVVLALAATVIVNGRGLWAARGWAWTLAVVSTAVGMAVSAVLLAQGSLPNVIDLLAGAWILWYLWRPYVREYFGKGPAPPRGAAPVNGSQP
jgi:uncharacterized membrane protein (DUF2068 family)